MMLSASISIGTQARGLEVGGQGTLQSGHLDACVVFSGLTAGIALLRGVN